MNINAIKDLAKNMRIDILNMTSNANSGHPGGSLSSTDIVSVLFGSIMNYDPSNPKWEDRDRFILSKAHACPVLYAALAETGFFEKSNYTKSTTRNSLSGPWSARSSSPCESYLHWRFPKIFGKQPSS